MKNVKKNTMFFGAVVVALLMVLTVTAVPQVQSEAVMDQIEQEEMIDSGFVKLCNMLNADGVISIDSEGKFYLDPTDELEKLYDEEGFINHILSDEVIQLLNEYYNDLVSDNSFQDIFNSGPVQDFIQSDEFITFRNSDEAQYIWNNFNPNTENLLDNQQEVSISEFNMYEQYASSFYIEEYAINMESSEATMSSSSDLLLDAEPSFWYPGFFLLFTLAIFMMLLIGIITWIPAIILAILLLPIGWLSAWSEVMYTVNKAVGWPFPILSLGLATFGVFLAVLIVIGVLAVWPLLVIIFMLIAASSFNPFPF